MLLFGVAPAAAQANALQASLVVPSPTPYLAQWASSPAVALLMVTNSSGVDVDATVTVTLVKDDQVVATVPSNITRLPGQLADSLDFIPLPTVTTFTTPSIAEWRAARLEGAAATSVSKTGGLPEGTYALCVAFQNVTPAGRTPYSVQDLQQCAEFQINNPEPPTLLLPADSDVVTQQNPVFSWTPVVVQGMPVVQYQLRVVEVLPRQTPTRALQANRPVFETTVSNLTSLPYPPSALPLEVGKRYAWRVRALAPGMVSDFGTTVTPLGRNGGLSEVFTFTRKALVAFMPVHIDTTTPPPSGPVAVPSPYFNRLLTGRLMYSFNPGDVPKPKQVDLSLPTFQNFQMMGGPAGDTPPPPPVSSGFQVSGGGHVRRGAPPKPLAGITVRLVVRYRTGSQWLTRNPIRVVGGKTYTDEGHVVATATTTADGRFIMAFNDDAPTGLVALPGQKVQQGSNEFVTTTNGPLARFYQIEVGDAHYLSPSDEITIDKGKSADTGTLVSLVRTYRLRVHVIDRETGNPPAAGEYRITIGRQKRPPDVPEDEGEGPRMALGVATLIASKTGAGNQPVTFDRLVRNIGPADRYRVAFSVPEGSEANYALSSNDYANDWRFRFGGGPNGEGTYNETYDFNLVGDDTLYVTPLPPRFIGQVVDAATLQPVDRALLVLIDEHNTARQLRRLQPSDKGKFVWDIPSTSGAEWNIDVVVPGYETTSVSVPTRRGYRRSQTIAVQPGAIVRGEVQGPDGTSVSADAWFGPKAKSSVAETKATPSYSGGRPTGPGISMSRVHFVSAFELHAPARADTLHIDPTAGGYCGVSLAEQLHHGVNDLGAITVPREDRRISVQVRSGTAPPYQVGVGQTRVFVPGALSGSKPIPGAVVEAVDVYEADGTTLRSATAGRDGHALLHLGPGAKQVKIRVRSPATGDYETRTANVSTTTCGDPAVVMVFLPPASRIAGTVYHGSGNGQPLKGAQVSVEGLPGLTATTDARGGFVLRNVPRQHVKLRAGGVNDGAVAVEREMDVSQARYQGVDFHLGGAATTALDWSHGLFGFDVSLSSVKPGQGGTFTVSGELVGLKANSTFATRNVDRLPFDDVVVRPDSVGRPVPAADSLPVGATSLPLRLFGHYNVRQANANGLVVRPGKGGVGAVRGPVDFEEPLIDVDFVSATGQPAQPALVPAAGTAALATVTADGAAPAGDTYRLAGAGGGRLRFTLYGFRADAAPDSTVLGRDSLRLSATVHTAIRGVQDLALPASGLTVTSGPNGGVAPFHTDHAFQRPLQKWTLRVDGWSLDNGMAHLTGGELDIPVDPKSGAGVSLPLVSIRLLPDGFQSAAFRDAPLSLGGMVDLDLSAKDLSFNRDGSDGPWRIYASTGASIPALPGMRPTDRIPLGLLKMQSDGMVAITPQHGTTVRLFDAADFHVASVVPGNQTLTLGGALDAAIPNVAPQTHSIIYRHDASGLHFDMVPIDIGPVAIGGAQLRIEDAVLDSTGLHGGGYVEVPGKFKVATRFVRTPPARGDTIEAIPVKGATIDVGQIAVSGLSGGSTVRNGRWQTKFGGDLHIGDNGSKGGGGNDQVGGSVSFTVEDADVSVGTAGLDIRNIQTPFGDLTISVNFPQQRFEGSMNIDGYLTDGLYANGRADMVISGAPANRYWYIYAGMGFRLDTPKLTGSAALIVGDATLGGQLLADFNQYSVHGVPPSFYRIRGFFLEGQVTWPVPVCPSGGFDIGVASVGIWCNIYGDLRMGMNFQEHNTYMIGALAGVDVGANGSLGLGLCVSLWGEVKAQAELEGGYRSDGAWYVLGDASIDLHGGASYGVGIDDVCLDKSTSFTIGLGAEGELGHNWNTGEGQFFRVHFR